MATQPALVSPYLRQGTDTRGMMIGMMLCLTLTAALFAWRYDAAFLFRYAGLLALAGGVDGLYRLLRSNRFAWPRASTFVTAALLVLSVPARMPWWQVASGILVAVLFGKCMVDPKALRVNPMLLGRLFLMLLFANGIQDWTVPSIPQDALSSATPLGLYAAEGATWPGASLWLGDSRGNWESIYDLLPGSPGDVLPLLTLFLGAWLYIAGIADWRPGFGFLAGFALTCPLLGLPVGFHLSAGSAMFTAVYIVSDPRSMPGSKSGRLVAGLLAGILNAVVRWHGYLPEGIVPAVLAVNLVSPTIDRIAFACFRSPR